MAGLARRYACACLLYVAQELGEAWLDSGVAMLTSSVLICMVPKEHPFAAFVVQTLTRHYRMGDPAHIARLNTTDTLWSHARRQIPTQG